MGSGHSTHDDDPAAPVPVPVPVHAHRADDHDGITTADPR
jgi:hypothetical protein